MSFVGDVLVYVREAGPDPSAPIQAPASLGVSTSTSAGTIPAGTYYFVFTGTNPWGESVASAESSFTLASSGEVTFTASGLPPGTAGGNVYIGTSPGAENGYSAFIGTTPLTLTTLANLGANIPPTRATGMNPDSDGMFIDAGTLYRFLKDGLKHLGRISKGILDHAGIQSITGTSMYRLPFGQWLRFTNAWYDGYMLDFISRAVPNYQNPITNIPVGFTVEELADGMAVQLYPQPTRTGGTTTLASPMSATATTASVVSTSGFFPQMGMAQIDSEVMFFSMQGSNMLTGILRGMSATIPTAHLAGAPVTELNINLVGYRMPQLYDIGQSMSILAVPFGWEDCLKDYCLARFRAVEQEHQESARLLQQADKAILDVMEKSRPKNGPRQVGGSSLNLWNRYNGGYPYYGLYD